MDLLLTVVGVEKRRRIFSWSSFYSGHHVTPKGLLIFGETGSPVPLQIFTSRASIFSRLDLVCVYHQIPNAEEDKPKMLHCNNGTGINRIGKIGASEKIGKMTQSKKKKKSMFL